jgi:quercetin dioxygenase-like cupin family protein
VTNHDAVPGSDTPAAAGDTEYRPAGTRRVISGVDGSGRSLIVADSATATRVVRPNGAVVEEIWRQESLPARAEDNGVRGPDLQLAPPAQGVVVRSYTCPPDSEMDVEAQTAAAAAIYGAGNVGSIPGMHRTDTLDVITVVDGEIVVVFDEGETLLRAGDSLVLPGTMHAWSNRSDRPANLVCTVFPLPT